MKRFIKQLGLFILLICIIDICTGKLFGFLVSNAIGGNNGRNNYICNKVHDDILIFGSSRALHHYNPIIISDSSGLSCYNCGQDGNGIILNYGRYRLISQRYTPKMIIYDVQSSFDLITGDDNTKYLGWLKAYYDKDGIPEIFESVDKKERYKMQSMMYRYNSKFMQILTDYIHPLKSDGIKGFLPIDEEMDTMLVNKKEEKKEELSYDSLKINYLKKFVDECKGSKIVFVVSPCWDGMETTSLQPIKKICKEKGLPFIDFSNDSRFVHHNELFKDGQHLNARGADTFTKVLVHKLKSIKLL